jgi:hypothetical protein
MGGLLINSHCDVSFNIRENVPFRSYRNSFCSYLLDGAKWKGRQQSRLWNFCLRQVVLCWICPFKWKKKYFPTFHKKRSFFSSSIKFLRQKVMFPYSYITFSYSQLPQAIRLDSIHLIRSIMSQNFYNVVKRFLF